MLGILFPYVERYNDNKELKPDPLYGDSTKYQNIARTRGIASAKYFDLYFSETENQYSVLGGLIDKFIQSINVERDSISSNFEELLKIIPSNSHKELIEIFQLNINGISDESIFLFLITLLRNIFRINDSSVFFGLSGRERCYYLMWELIQRLNDDEFENFVLQMSKQYDQILTINTISYWFSKDKDNKNIEGRVERWNQLETEIIKEIIDSDINLYDDNYYHFRNIWALYRNTKDDLSIFRSYLNKHINRQSVFRMLYDCINHSIGNSHRYYFESEKLSQLFDEELLKKYMKDIVTQSEDEEILLRLYC